jgi:hypothetical protein
MKTTQIDPSALYWAPFNRFELRLPGECVLDCSHSGACDDDVARHAPLVREQMESDDFQNKPTADAIREELREYGAWDAEELADDDANWLRLVWIAAGNIAEEEQPDCSDPVCGLPAYRVSLEDGSSYVTSMASGVTLADARAHLLGQRLTQNDETTRLLVVSVNHA